MTAATQEQALLDLIAADRTRRCSEILEAAQRQGDELLREAHRHARARLRKVLSEARERADQRLAAALAQRQTRERLAQQNSTSEFLRHAMQLLPAALMQRWRQPEACLRWVQTGVLAAAPARHANWWQSLPERPV